MRTAIELNATTAKKLRSIAKERHVSLDELLTAHIPGLASLNFSNSAASVADKVRALGQWVRSFPKTSRPLSDEEISRSSIYCDR